MDQSKVTWRSGDDGTITIEGKADFVTSAVGPVSHWILSRHVASEVAKGRNRDAVINEMVEAIKAQRPQLVEVGEAHPTP